MRRRTTIAATLLLVVGGGLAVAGVATYEANTTEVTVEWVSDTARETGGNHHAPAVWRDGNHSLVFAPISGQTDTSSCELAALAGTDGSVVWRDGVPAPNCTVHSVANPTVADYDRDGTAEVFAATTEDRLFGFEAETGAVEFRHNLTAYGYTKPLVTDVVGGPAPEIVVVDVTGTISVLAANGTTHWTRRLDAYTWAQPVVADFDHDGEPEVAVGAGGSGELHLFDHDGTSTWTEPTTFESSIGWLSTDDLDGDTRPEIVVATALDGRVVAVDGDGTRQWEHDLARLAAVGAVFDGDRDGTLEVYAVSSDGVLRALDGQTGREEWTSTLTTEAVQMMPPPSAGDVDGDDRLELVAPAHDGSVSLVDPKTGAVRATYERRDTIYVDATLADVDGDGNSEAFVMYGHGRIARLDFGSVDSGSMF